MNLFFWKKLKPQNPLVTSRLFDEKNFYSNFVRDLGRAKEEVIVECPFITTKRMDMLYPFFSKLVKKGVRIYIVTRDPREHDGNMMQQAENEIKALESIGVQVLLCEGNHHRKIAILDKEILWEGSLNILSHCYSKEIMRRIQGIQQAKEMFHFLKLNRVI